MSKERQLYRSNVWCTVRVESDLWGLSKKYFIDFLMFPFFFENQLKNPVFQPFPTHTPYMFCIVNIVGPTVRDVIAADIILNRVMIKRYLITLLENNDADQPTQLHSLTNPFALAASIIQCM